MTAKPTPTVADVIAAAQEAWTAQDVEGALVCFDPGIVFTIHLPEDIDFAGPCRGHDENRRMMHAIVDKFHFLRRVIERVVVDGDRATVSIYYHYMHKATREIVHGRYKQIWIVREGRAVRVDEYHDTPYFTAFMRFVALLSSG